MLHTDRPSSDPVVRKVRSRTRKPAALPLAALLLVVSGTTAHAQVSASASLSNIRFETLDLRPDDGVTGGYTMKHDDRSQGFWDQSSWVMRQRGGDNWEYFIDLGDSYGDETHSEAPAAAAYSGSATHDPASGYSSEAALSKRGAVHATASSLLAAISGIPHTEDRWAGLRVDPYTSLTISFDAVVAGHDLGLLDGATSSARSHVFINWEGVTGGSAYSSARLDVGTLLDDKADSFARSERLQLTITNDEPDYLVGSLHLGADAVAAAVPEPSTYALFVAGLGALGWAVRRRNVSPATAEQRSA